MRRDIDGLRIFMAVDKDMGSVTIWSGVPESEESLRFTATGISRDARMDFVHYISTHMIGVSLMGMYLELDKA